MAVMYAQVAAQAFELSPSDRWRLVTELVGLEDAGPRASAKEFFGVNGPLEDDVDARVRRGRDE